jgi:hypothetical protein
VTRTPKTPAQRAQDDVEALTRRLERYRSARTKAVTRRDEVKAKYEPLIHDAETEARRYDESISATEAELAHAKAHPALREQQGGQIARAVRGDLGG